MIAKVGVYGGLVRYGSDEAAVTPTAAAPGKPMNPEQLLNTALPLIQTLTEGLNDPFRKLELAKARLENARSRGASSSKLRLLEAKVRAAEQAAGLRSEATESTREWRGLGKIGIVTGIGVGVSLIVFILVKAFK